LQPEFLDRLRRRHVGHHQLLRWTAPFFFLLPIARDVPSAGG